jgi:hypothetical protein
VRLSAPAALYVCRLDVCQISMQVCILSRSSSKNLRVIRLRMMLLAGFRALERVSRPVDDTMSNVSAPYPPVRVSTCTMMSLPMTQ